MQANSESKAFRVASCVSCSLKQSGVSCCWQAVGKGEKLLLWSLRWGIVCGEIRDDTGAWVWKSKSPRIGSFVSSQGGPACLRKVKYWELR